MELYAEAKYKQLAVEYALQLTTKGKVYSTATELVESAKTIEEYLKSGS